MRVFGYLIDDLILYKTVISITWMMSSKVGSTRFHCLLGDTHDTFVDFSWKHVRKDLEPFQEHMQVLKCASHLPFVNGNGNGLSENLQFLWTVWLWW